MIKINTKAFTLAEALVNLLLISIIISLAYTLINFFSKQLSQLEKDNYAIVDYNLFDASIRYDIYNAHFFNLENNELNVYDYSGKKVTYQVSDKKISRQTSTHQDVFNMDVISYSINTLDTVLKDKTLNLKVSLLTDTLSLNYYLKQSNAELINKTIFDEARD